MLVLTSDSETGERIKSEIGGPWMNEHIAPLLAGPPGQSSGAVVAGSPQWR